MDDQQTRLFTLIVVSGVTCLIGVGVGLRLIVQHAIDTIVQQASHKQLLLDAESMRLGKPLRAISGNAASTNRILLAALDRV